MPDDSDWFHILLRIIATVVMLCVVFGISFVVGGILLLLVVAR